MPELRWWAYGGTGGGTGVTFRGGPIVARFGPHGERGDVRCIVVPGNQQYSSAGSPALYVFRFHPCECYSPNDGPAAPIYTISFGVAGESVHSTPLAIEVEIAEMVPSLRELVIVQSTHRVYCFDFTGLNYENVCALPPSITTPLWTYPEDDENDFVFTSTAAAPTVARASDVATTTYVLAMGFRPPRGDATDAARADDMELVWLDPATGSEVHVAELRHLVPIGSPPQLPAPRLTTCPAVGPTEEERGSEDPIRNMVFTGLHISASPPLYLSEVNLRAFLVDPAGTYAGSLEKGRNWGSPVLHENGDGIYPDDGTEVNSFDNLLTDPISSRWSPLSDTYVFSCSAGVFPDRTTVFWREASGLLRGVEDPISGSPTRLLGNVGTVPAAIGGAPALDKFGRWFMISDVNGKVSARLRSYDADLDFFKAWAVPQPPGTIPPVTFPPYTPPIINFTDDLAQPADPGMAIDEDGTLICANEGYIFAIRPLPGDFDGDGCRTYFDIDAFVLALLGPIPPATLTWEQTYGAARGVNLLGIGDLNNDGFFGNADIDGFVALMVDHLGCPDGTDDPMSFDCSAEDELFGESFCMSAGGDDAAGLSDREIAIQRLTPLYDHFGMLPPW